MGSLLLYDFSFAMIKPSSKALFLLPAISKADFFLETLVDYTHF